MIHAAVAALSAALLAAPHPTVLITELPSLSADYRASVRAVADDGTVIGTDSPVNTGSQHAVLWRGTAPVDLGTGEGVAVSRDGKVLISEYVGSAGSYRNRVRVWERGTATHLDPPGGTFVSARSINTSGTVPLSYSTTPTDYRATASGVWRNGAFTRSGDVAQGLEVAHSLVNDHGVTAGYRVSSDSAATYAFRCDPVCARLPGTTGAGPYAVSDVNESGVVVGTRQDGLRSQALRWDPDGVAVLPGPGAVSSGRQAVNDRGDVVGYRWVDGVRRAALWRDLRSVDLGVSGESESVAVNNRGEVVGWHTVGDRQLAFLWRNGKLTNLGSVDGRFSSPVALNDNGVVVGTSSTPTEYFQAVKWTVRR